VRPTATPRNRSLEIVLSFIVLPFANALRWTQTV
jgi:hypothetical protein